MRWSRIMLCCAGLCMSVAAQAETLIGPGGECVPFARQMSGIQIVGNAWTWWDQAAGRYARGPKPRVGAVIVFRPLGAMKLGHVAVVSRIVTRRVIMVTHANWSRIGGVRGRAERDVTVIDASPAGDWSQVKVWFQSNDALGGTVYPIYGFIYGAPSATAPGTRAAAPSPELSGKAPDFIGALIDAG